MVRLGPAHALVLGTLTVGALDLLDAFIFFGLRIEDTCEGRMFFWSG